MSAPVESRFFADFSNLAAIKREAKAQSPDALRQAARQFESLFTQMMLKSMRAATPQDSLMGSDQQEFYQEMFDQQMAVQLSRGRGMGLADMLVKQLMQQNGVAAVPLDTSLDQTAQPQSLIDLPGSPVFRLNETPSTQASGVMSPRAQRGTMASMAGALPRVTPVIFRPASVPSLMDPSAANWPPASREDFVKALMPAATEAGRQLGIDPGTLIAHAALETGWGKFMPTDADGNCSFNLFGIKAGRNYDGEQVSAVTKEFDNGAMQTTRAQFRSYDSPADCMRDYVELLSGSDRYSDALGTGEDSGAFASALQRGGYATDPNYANKLTGIARELKSRLSAPLKAGDAA
ncbi:MAG: flagellar assembly peptidoglycan hydrolase FlgJ [Steroidobacteraceae bacterium]